MGEMRALLLTFFSHRFLAIGRWDLHFLFLRIRAVMTGRKRRIRRFLNARARPSCLNLGSGPRGKGDEHWVNVDGCSDRNVHFLVDFTRPLPFPDSAFSGVFCEHVMEHFSLMDGEMIAREVRRILQPEGVFRVIVPDAMRIMRSYFDDPEMLMKWRGGEFRTPMEVVNSYFRQRYEHQFLYDFDTMEAMLRRAGFSEVRRTGIGEGAYSGALVLDDPKYAWESLYVEARR